MNFKGTPSQVAHQTIFRSQSQTGIWGHGHGQGQGYKHGHRHRHTDTNMDKNTDMDKDMDTFHTWNVLILFITFF
jgi:hypothetical protein